MNSRFLLGAFIEGAGVICRLRVSGLQVSGLQVNRLTACLVFDHYEGAVYSKLR